MAINMVKRPKAGLEVGKYEESEFTFDLVVTTQRGDYIRKRCETREEAVQEEEALWDHINRSYGLGSYFLVKASTIDGWWKLKSDTIIATAIIPEFRNQDGQ